MLQPRRILKRSHLGVWTRLWVEKTAAASQSISPRAKKSGRKEKRTEWEITEIQTRAGAKFVMNFSSMQTREDTDPSFCPQGCKFLAKRTRKSTQVRTYDGRPNRFSSRLRSSPKSQKVINFTHIQMTCDQLVSTCVGWPNGEKLASTCVRILSSTKVKASGWSNETQVERKSKTCESVWPAA